MEVMGLSLKNHRENGAGCKHRLEEKLIDLRQERPCLYDAKSKEYRKWLNLPGLQCTGIPPRPP